MIIRPSAFGSIAAVLVLGGCAAGGGVHTTAGTAPTSCLKDTASTAPADAFNCTPGRSYSKSDIYNTGATTAAGALRQLDPSITIGH